MLVSLTAIGIFAINMTIVNLDIAANLKASKQALYLAEAGIQHARIFLQQPQNNWNTYAYTTPTDLILAGNSAATPLSTIGTYTVTSQDAGGEARRVQSTGNTGSKAEAVIETLMVRSSFPFDSGAFGKDVLTIGSGGRTDSYNSATPCPPGADAGYCVASQGPGNRGDVGSNGNISLDSGAQVNGNATAGGTVTLDTGSLVTGTSTNGAPPRDLPPVDATYRTPNSNLTGITIINPGPGGDTRYDPVTHDLQLGANAKVQLSGGTYYFRNLTLDEAAKLVITGDATVYLTGVFTTATASQANVDSSPASKFNLASRLVIYSSCTTGTPYCVDVDGGSGFSGAVYAPNGAIRTDHGGNVYGSLIGGSISNDSGTNFHYDEALGNLASPFGDIKIVSWRQL
jgi:hypothetical protein